MSALHNQSPALSDSFVMKAASVFVLSSLLAAAGALLAALGLSWVFALAVALVFFFIARLLGCTAKAAQFLTFSFLLMFLLGQTRLSSLQPDNRDLSQLRASAVSFGGSVLSCKTKDTDQGLMATVEVKADRLLCPYTRDLRGCVLVHAGPFASDSGLVPAWGRHYIFSGRLVKPRDKVFSFEFDEKRRLMLKNIFCQFSCQPSGITSTPSEIFSQSNISSDGFSSVCCSLVKAVVLVREGIVNAHCSALGQDRGKLLTSMVLGDRAVSLSDDLKETFARVGLSHLLAASGLNLTIIVGAAIFFFNLPRGKRQGAGGLGQTLGALVCVLFFVSLAGVSPSVTRATVMCLLLLWAGLTFRRLALGTALAGALWLALVYDPLSVLDVGLELSYGATFGIIYFYPIFSSAAPPLLTKRPWHFFASICAVVVAAQLAVLPVQINCFQKISTLVLPANILAEPLVAPITVLGFVSSFIAALAVSISSLVVVPHVGALDLAFFAHWLDQLVAGLDFFCRYLLDILLLLTRFLAGLPLAYVHLARPPVISVVFYYAALAVAFILGLTKPRSGTLIAFGSGLLLILQSFFLSSCLEILLTEDCVVIAAGQERPTVLLFSRTSSSGLGRAGYLSSFHRDFAQSYLRSLRAKGQPQVKSINCLSQAQSARALALGPTFSFLKKPMAYLQFLNCEPQVIFSVAPGAIELEEAQDVRFYKVRTWGLLWLIARGWQENN